MQSDTIHSLGHSVVLRNYSTLTERIYIQFAISDLIQYYTTLHDSSRSNTQNDLHIWYPYLHAFLSIKIVNNNASPSHPGPYLQLCKANNFGLYISFQLLFPFIIRQVKYNCTLSTVFTSRSTTFAPLFYNQNVDQTHAMLNQSCGAINR